MDISDLAMISCYVIKVTDLVMISFVVMVLSVHYITGMKDNRKVQVVFTPAW